LSNEADKQAKLPSCWFLSRA